MVEAKMRIGPKGQVVIPKLLRDEFGFLPGEEVIISDNGEGVLVRRTIDDPIAVFHKIAMSRRVSKKFPVHGYEKAIEERWKKLKGA